MQKREVQQEVKPIRSYIDTLEIEEKRIGRILDKLKLLQLENKIHLTDETLILIKGNKVCVIPEEARSQLEQLGKMSLRIDNENVYELETFGVGRVYGNISVVEKFVLPEKDKILAVKGVCDTRIPETEKSESLSMLETYLESLEKGYHKDTISSLLRTVIDKKDKEDIELLRNYKYTLHTMLVDPSIGFEKVLETNWEMIANTCRVLHTKHYMEKVKNTPGALVFHIHIHPFAADRSSLSDVLITSGPKQDVEWSGRLWVIRDSQGEFKVTTNHLVAYNAEMNDLNWLRHMVSKLSKTEFEESDQLSLLNKFESSHQAWVTRWESLLSRYG